MNHRILLWDWSLQSLPSIQTDHPVVASTRSCQNAYLSVWRVRQHKHGRKLIYLLRHPRLLEQLFPFQLRCQVIEHSVHVVRFWSFLRVPGQLCNEGWSIHTRLFFRYYARLWTKAEHKCVHPVKLFPPKAFSTETRRNLDEKERTNHSALGFRPAQEMDTQQRLCVRLASADDQ